jgi:hypothetical protein
VISEVPLVILETLATGIPLVTTPLAGVGDFSSPGRCSLATAGNVSELAKALEQTYLSIDQNKLPKFDQKHLLEQFSHQRFRQEISTLIEETC